MRQEVQVYVTIKLKSLNVRDLNKVMRATGRWVFVQRLISFHALKTILTLCPQAVSTIGLRVSWVSETEST